MTSGTAHSHTVQYHIFDQSFYWWIYRGGQWGHLFPPQNIIFLPYVKCRFSLYLCLFTIEVSFFFSLILLWRFFRRRLERKSVGRTGVCETLGERSSTAQSKKTRQWRGQQQQPGDFTGKGILLREATRAAAHRRSDAQCRYSGVNREYSHFQVLHFMCVFKCTLNKIFYYAAMPLYVSGPWINDHLTLIIIIITLSMY